MWGRVMPKTVSESRIEERIENLANKLDRIEAILASLSLSVSPEKLCIKNLSVNEVNFNLRSLGISDLSGVLNIGITTGFAFPGSRAKKGFRPETEKIKQNESSSSSTEQGKIARNPKLNPACRILFKGN